MNRLAHAFSGGIPNSNSDASSTHLSHSSPRAASPTDISAFTSLDRLASTHSLMYDDPRSSHSSFGTSNPGSLPKRLDPSGSRTPQGRSAISRCIRVNLMASTARGKRAWGMSNVTSGSRLTSMAKGPEGKYAVGGGQYLRVHQISPHGQGSNPPMARGQDGTAITEVVNLWRGSWTVGKGVNDLDWGVGAFNNKIVTVTPSGDFLIFDINRGRLEKEVSGGHPRPLNVVKLCQQPSHGHMLITGGTEGQTKLWDMREHYPSSRKYFKHSSTITSLCFGPDDSFQILVGLDNGAIQRYDLRYQHISTGRVWGAHGNKAVMDLKWKPEEHDGEWLASAGADRTVQVWDMSQSWDRPPTPVHSLHTAYPLRRLAWRPGHETELVIVPLEAPLSSGPSDPSADSVQQGLDLHPQDGDAHLEIWDVRRHYVAKFALPTQDGSAVEVAWTYDNLIACFRDGVFAQLDLKHRTIPLEQVPRQVMAWSAREELAYGLDRFKVGEIPFDDLKDEYANHWDRVGQKLKGVSDPTYQPMQALGVIPFSDAEDFAYMANHYRLEGDTPRNLCRWNAEIAEVCGRHDDARLWFFLKHLIEEFTMYEDCDDESSRAVLTTSPQVTPRPAAEQETFTKTNIAIPVALERVIDTSHDIDTVEELLSVSGSSSASVPTSASLTPSRFSTFIPPDSRRESEANVRVVSGSKVFAMTPLVPTAKSSESSDEDASLAESATPATRMAGSRMINDWPDPYGIAPDMSSGIRSSPMPSQIDSIAQNSPKLQPAIALDGNVRPTSRSAMRDIAPLSSQKPKLDAKETEAWNAYRKARCKPLLQWWQSFNEDGEVQLATAVAIVGSSIMDFPTQQCERIAHAYVDLLERHRLHVPAVYVRRYAGVASLETPSEDVTRIIRCGRCQKSTGSLDDIGSGKEFWWCKRCRQAARICAICHRGVRGLWTGCGKCHHGGHQQCMALYYVEAEHMIIPVVIHTDNPVPRQQTASSIAVTSTSHDSGFAGRNRSSGETARTSEPGSLGDVDGSTGWNGCPTGCGCRCSMGGPTRRQSG